MVTFLIALLALFPGQAKAIYVPSGNSITACGVVFADAFTNSKFKILYGLVQTSGRFSTLVDGAGTAYSAPTAGFVIRAVNTIYSTSGANLYATSIGWGTTTVANSVSAPTGATYIGGGGVADFPVHQSVAAASESYVSSSCLAINFTIPNGDKPFVTGIGVISAVVYGYEQ